jgi:hypothetical protein
MALRIFGANVAPSSNGVDPSFMNSVAGSYLSSQVAQILHDRAFFCWVSFMLTVTYADAVAPRQDKNSTTVAENNFEGILTKVFQYFRAADFLARLTWHAWFYLAQGRLTEGEGSVRLTFLFRSAAFQTETMFFSFFTKQPILKRRSTVLILPFNKASLPCLSFIHPKKFYEISMPYLVLSYLYPQRSILRSSLLSYTFHASLFRQSK